MRREDREARAKELGRAAYGAVVPHKKLGNIEVDGELKKYYKLEDDGLSVVLTLPSDGRDADRCEMARLTVRLDDQFGKAVLDLRWNRDGHFEIIRYLPGNGDDWEEIILWDWEPPMPF
jgi:hypothetical protein